MVLTFHVPNSVVVFGVRRGFGIAASLRLSQRCFIQAPEGAFSPTKTDVISCMFLMVSVILDIHLMGDWPFKLHQSPVSQAFPGFRAGLHGYRSGPEEQILHHTSPWTAIPYFPVTSYHDEDEGLDFGSRDP